MHLACQKKKNQSIVLRLTSASVLIRTRGWARPSSSGWGSWPTATPRHWSVRGRSSSPTTFPATASGAAKTKDYFNRRSHLIFIRNSNQMFKEFQRYLLPTHKKNSEQFWKVEGLLLSTWRAAARQPWTGGLWGSCREKQSFKFFLWETDDVGIP